MKKILLTLLIVFTQIALASEEEKPLYYIGAYGAYNSNMHISNFNKLGDLANCCQKFENGSGSGFSFGALFEYPMIPEILIGARLGFSSIGAILSRDEDIGNTLILRSGNPVTAYVRTNHSIDTKIYTVGLEPYLNYKFFGVLSSYIGFNLSYMMTGELDQKEEIISPGNVRFLDGRVIQNDVYAVEIPEKNTLLFFGVFGLGYDLKVSETIILTPEVKYYLPINNISAEDWKASVWQFGAALKIPIYPAKVLPIIKDTIYARDTTLVAVLNLKEENIRLINRSYQTKEIEETKEDEPIIILTKVTENYERQINKIVQFNSSITAVGIKRNGTEETDPKIVIEEIEVEEGFPLLPYVFFKAGSSKLLDTDMKLLNKQAVNRFSEDSLSRNTLDIYANMLNIIGYRMKQLSSKKITVVGCNNNSGVEKNNTRLSKERAIAVENYLVNVWGIDEKRIKVNWQNLPDKPGNKREPDGIAENQRAELQIKDLDMMKPVSLKDIERSSNPPIVALYPKVDTEAGLKSWQIDVKQGDDELRHFEGKDIPNELIWQLEDNPMPKLESPINITLKAEDELGQTTFSETTLNLQQLTIKKKRFELKDDKRIERFFLIVFDFNKADIKPHHRAVLKDIKSRIMPNSKVTISGYTDRIGDPEYNLELARRRTLEVQKVLRVKEENLTLNPVGSGKILFDNDLPQGRSYSRTVQIVIETPVK